MKRTFSSLALLAATLVSGTALAADNEVNVYSYRQPYLIEPMLKEFTKETGIKVNMVYAEKGLVERLKREGELSPADVVLTVDISRVMEVVNAGLAQPLQDAVLEKNIPAQYRDSDGRWFALTLRARAIYSSKDRVGPLPLSFTYADLADPKYKGKVCVRSGKNAYNVSLVASMIAHQGVEKTRAWLEGVKANLAQKPQGGDRDQVKAIKEG
ncbi:MAG: extracellular solute-binding protein, partial [Plesiomonas shigelloides]